MALEEFGRSRTNGYAGKAGSVFYTNIEFAIDVAHEDRAHVAFTWEHILSPTDVRYSEHHYRSECS